MKILCIYTELSGMSLHLYVNIFDTFLRVSFKLLSSFPQHVFYCRKI